MKTLEEARQQGQRDELAYIRAKLEAAIKESEAAPEKCKLHFGYFETSDGDL